MMMRVGREFDIDKMKYVNLLIGFSRRDMRLRLKYGDDLSWYIGRCIILFLSCILGFGVVDWIIFG